MNKAWDMPATVFILSDKGSICEEGSPAGMLECSYQSHEVAAVTYLVVSDVVFFS